MADNCCIPDKKQPLCIVIGKAYAHAFVVYTDQEQTALKDFTGYTGRAFIRETNAAATTLAQFTVTFGGMAGTVTFSLTAIVTGALTAGNGKVWDLEWTPPGGTATMVMKGTANFILPVTR